LVNFLFVFFIIAGILAVFFSIVYFYPPLLSWCLENKQKFLSMPMAALLIGFLIWNGFERTFSFIPDPISKTEPWQTFNEIFPGVGKEFMPALDEGSFLLMPTTMPHSGVAENLEVIRLLDLRVNAIPEVEYVVGKWGRVNSALDPAPVSMFENMTKSLGNKRHVISPKQIEDITRIYGENVEGKYCKIFDNEDFGFQKITVERPLRLNFQASPDRIERLREHRTFQNLATSRKKKGSKGKKGKGKR